MTAAREELALLADDEPLSRDFLREALTALGVRVVAVGDGSAALRELERRAFDYVFTDLQMPGVDGLGVLAQARQRDPDVPVLLVTAHGTMNVAVRALRGGAADILEKPVSPDDLELALARVRERRRLLRENRYLRAQSVGEELAVCGPATRAVVELVERVARSDATVLITGESGTGKERVAALVHRRSDRAERAFVKINCAAVPEALIESEFFGHEAGAFTGAQRRREGLFELADGGTLFLDEVGEMPLPLQTKLLRVLQEGEVTRVGGSSTKRVDVRVVAASNRDLPRAVRAGRFREDLFYRLNVVPIEVPPLRARRDEIVPLARLFLARGAALSACAERALERHGWPGNVRELQNLMQRASLLSGGRRIDAALLAPWLGESAPLPPPAGAGDPLQALVGRSLRQVEDELIRATLAACDDNRTRAAELLGIGVRTLYDKLKAERTPAS
jgi:DNA-binding NtrC family response regulator